jgi:capsular polysaccharide biosynthesis protein
MTVKEQPLRVLFASWRVLVGFTVLGSVLGLALSLIQPLQYASTVRVLITQPGAVGLDAFTIQKSNERIAQNLSQLLLTSTFFENILGQAQGFDTTYFPADEYERRRLWQESISIALESGSGLMQVAVYHKNADQAKALVLAATNELARQAPNYFGSAVRVQVIDAPLNSRWYARPNFVNNAFYGAAVGFMLGII